MDEVLLQYGALGALAVAALMAVRVMFARLSTAYDRERERADRLEKELQALNTAVRSEYIGTIAHASQIIQEATRAVADALKTVREDGHGRS
jgi:hypothetical protein